MKTIPLLNKSHLWIEMSTTDEEDMKMLSNIIECQIAFIFGSPLVFKKNRKNSQKTQKSGNQENQTNVVGFLLSTVAPQKYDAMSA